MSRFIAKKNFSQRSGYKRRDKIKESCDFQRIGRVRKRTNPERRGLPLSRFGRGRWWKLERMSKNYETRAVPVQTSMTNLLSSTRRWWGTGVGQRPSPRFRSSVPGSGTLPRWKSITLFRSRNIVKRERLRADRDDQSRHSDRTPQSEIDSTFHRNFQFSILSLEWLFASIIIAVMSHIHSAIVYEN